DPRVPGVQGQPDLRRDPHHLSGLPQGLPDPGRDPGDADQRGAALDPRRVSARAATQAVILAGGQGTRLRPLTLARAKPVVPLLGRPFLAYQLALLRAHGVTDVILACSYRVDDVKQALGEAEHLGVRLRYVVESEPPATAEEPITTDTINAGIYLIDAAQLARMPTGKAVSIEREFFPALIADGVPSYGWIADSYWRDIGSPAAYRAAQLDMLDGRVRTAL